MDSVNEQTSLFDQEKITVISSPHNQADRSLRGRFKSIIEQIKDFRAYDTQKYVDMLAANDTDIDEFEVHSDH